MTIAAPFPSVHGSSRSAGGRTARPVARRRSSGHLTRRGRVVVAVLTCLLAVAGLAMTGPRADAATDRGQDVRTVVVQSGESVWSIATTLVDGGDPRPMVKRIRELNDLGPAGPVAGQTLVVPRIGD